jgi:hypothetical protein
MRLTKRRLELQAEAARYCVQNRLSTPLGKPAQVSSGWVRAVARSGT